MQGQLASRADAHPAEGLRCAHGHDAPARFRFSSRSGAQTACFRHGVTHRPIVKVAVLTSLVVGTILTAINQGNVLLSGAFPDELFWKIPLTYAVPYSVSTWAALRISWIGR